MHNNYYFLRQLTKRLDPVLREGVISECFSQEKDELIIRTESAEGSFYLRATTRPDLGCVSFPRTFARARKNSVDLFPDIIGRRIKGLRQFNNERSFALLLSDNVAVLFKLHGNRANVLVIRDGVVAAMFRNKLVADATIQTRDLDREIDWSFEAFQAHVHNPSSLYFTFGKLVWKYLNAQGFSEAPVDKKWDRIQQLIQGLEAPAYFLSTVEEKPVLSLLDFGAVEKKFTDPVEAINAFYAWHNHAHTVGDLKAKLLRQLRLRLESSHHYCEKNKLKLGDLEHGHNYREWADLIMANLHTIPAGAGQVALEDFYHNNALTEVRLKKDHTPQQNAAIYYRKAKNQRLEVERLQASIERRRAEMAELQSHIEAVVRTEEFAALKKIKDDLVAEIPDRGDTISLPYHEFVFRDFSIWVGKNARANDVLTLKLAHKDDLWLHAKDVAGSHVVVRRRPGMNFPKDVVEFAAALAAYNSKRKTETLCPVIITPRKYVRKRKGDPAGAVIVDREEVIMVEPRMPLPPEAH